MRVLRIESKCAENSDLRSRQELASGSAYLSHRSSQKTVKVILKQQLTFNIFFDVLTEK